MPILHISTLSLHHFRNYTHARLEVSLAPVVLFGHNGAGKTNILESISLLVPGRGLHRAKLSEIDCQLPLSNSPPQAGESTGSPSPSGRASWVVTSTAHGAQGEVMIGTGRDAENTGDTERRDVRIDGKPRPVAELGKHLRLLWLTPQMEQVFLSSNSEGRRFLDRLTAFFDEEHVSHINAYDNAMRERNRLLEQGGDDAWLSSLEHMMSEKASAIAASRLSTLQTLNAAIAESHLNFPKPMLIVGGQVEDAIAQGASALAAEEKLAELLRRNRSKDRAAGRSLLGTHRSELTVMHREKKINAALCSTGEQKALLLSIILAQSLAGSRWNAITPIILLDEVVAHLDPARRLELFDEIRQCGAQVWMTGTDDSLFSGICGDAQFFEVKNARISG